MSQSAARRARRARRRDARDAMARAVAGLPWMEKHRRALEIVQGVDAERRASEDARVAESLAAYGFVIPKEG